MATQGAGTGATSMDAAVAGLEARLARGGGSDADWTLLAQAYDFLGRPEDAKRARNHVPSPKAAGAPLSVAALAAASASLNSQAGVAGAVKGTPDATSLAQPAGRGDSQDWLAVADARRATRDFAGARAAYDKAIERKQMTAQAWADYADTVASLQGGTLAGPAGAAIDQALALDPSNVKALWLKASQAHEQRRYSEALGWWGKLRAVLPANSADARIIDGNIAEDKALAGNNTTPTSANLTPQPSGAVSGTVAVDGRYAGRIAANATLFIYAKSVDSPGPPLAVLRTTAANWPVSFQLDDTLAMIPGRKLSQFDRVVIEARISRSGQATPATGDLYARSPVLRTAEGRKLALVIDHEIG